MCYGYSACMDVCVICISVYHMLAWYLRRPEECDEFGIGVKGFFFFELPCGCCESYLVLEEESVFSVAKPSLWHPFCFILLASNF